MNQIVQSTAFNVQVKNYLNEIQKKFDVLENESHNWFRHKFDEITQIFQKETYRYNLQQQHLDVQKDKIFFLEMEIQTWIKKYNDYEEQVREKFKMVSQLINQNEDQKKKIQEYKRIIDKLTQKLANHWYDIAQCKSPYETQNISMGQMLQTFIKNLDDNIKNEFVTFIQQFKKTCNTDEKEFNLVSFNKDLQRFLNEYNDQIIFQNHNRKQFINQNKSRSNSFLTNNDLSLLRQKKNSIKHSEPQIMNKSIDCQQSQCKIQEISQDLDSKSQQKIFKDQEQQTSQKNLLLNKFILQQEINYQNKNDENDKRQLKIVVKQTNNNINKYQIFTNDNDIYRINQNQNITKDNINLNYNDKFNKDLIDFDIIDYDDNNKNQNISNNYNEIIISNNHDQQKQTNKQNILVNNYQQQITKDDKTNEFKVTAKYEKKNRIQSANQLNKNRTEFHQNDNNCQNINMISQFLSQKPLNVKLGDYLEQNIQVVPRQKTTKLYLNNALTIQKAKIQSKDTKSSINSTEQSLLKNSSFQNKSPVKYHYKEIQKNRRISSASPSRKDNQVPYQKIVMLQNDDL